MTIVPLLELPMDSVLKYCISQLTPRHGSGTTTSFLLQAQMNRMLSTMAVVFLKLYCMKKNLQLSKCKKVNCNIKALCFKVRQL